MTLRLLIAMALSGAGAGVIFWVVLWALLTDQPQSMTDDEEDT